uniref:Phosphorylase b kinase regulatory subunit n=1 Tax=Timema monikensis TaxID=170555 RepID=A0A7R9HKV9_9NEOP|nr:unnamed protein product [Timema monikensis]
MLTTLVTYFAGHSSCNLRPYLPTCKRPLASQLFHQKVSAPNITSEVTTDLTERRFIFVVSQSTVAKSPRSQLCLKVMSWVGYRLEAISLPNLKFLSHLEIKSRIKITCAAPRNPTSSTRQVHDPTIGDVTENCRTAGTVDPGQGVNQLGTYFSSHLPVYEKDIKPFVWNCALHSAGDVVFGCCAHAHIRGGAGEEGGTARIPVRQGSIGDVDIDMSLKISNYEDTVRQLDIYYGLVKRQLLRYQSSITGLFPVLSTDEKLASVRDSLYCAAAVWSLYQAYRSGKRIDDDRGKSYELGQSAVKCMRGILECWIKQAPRIELFKVNQCNKHALHCKFHLVTGDVVYSDEEYPHLQVYNRE